MGLCHSASARTSGVRMWTCTNWLSRQELSLNTVYRETVRAPWTAGTGWRIGNGSANPFLASLVSKKKKAPPTSAAGCFPIQTTLNIAHKNKREPGKNKNIKEIPILGRWEAGRGETADLEPVARLAAEAKEQSRLLPNTQKDRLLGKAHVVEGMKNRKRESSGPVVITWVCTRPHSSSPSLPAVPHPGRPYMRRW